MPQRGVPGVRAAAQRRRGRRAIEHDLRRFIDAQAAVYDHVRSTELRAGRKTGHWMWFVFPQIAGLGRSPTAQHYAIASLDEARAYLDHPVLGRRLRESAEILTNLDGGSAERDLRRDRRDEAPLVDDAVRPRRARTSRCSRRCSTGTSTALPTRRPTTASSAG